jgi:hypothetical protein
MAKNPEGPGRFTVLAKASGNLTETESMQTGILTTQFET